MNLFIRLALVISILCAALPAAARQDTTAEPTSEAAVAGPISTVNGQEVAAADFQARVRLARFRYGYLIREGALLLVRQGADAETAFSTVQRIFSSEIDQLLISDLLGADVLNEMERETIIRQRAVELGIEVDDADIEAVAAEYLRTLGGLVDPDVELPAAEATAEATPENAETRVEDFYSEAEERVGVSAETIRDYFRTRLLRERVIEAEQGALPTEWPQITVRHILVETEAEANDVLARLEAGEDFAALAEELSLDENSAANGGSLGTSIAENYLDPFGKAVVEAPVGEVIGPVQTAFGYHVIEVTARETLPVDLQAERALRASREREFTTSLDAQMAQADITRVDDWPSLIPAEPDGLDLVQAMLEGIGG